MSIRLRRPTDEALNGLLGRCRDTSLTYSPLGRSLDGATPKGLHRHSWSVALPVETYDAAVGALNGWAVHRTSGLTVVADGPIEVGTNVAMSAPLPVGFVDATCRIVAVVNEAHRAGFAYGTLPVHPEIGEEAFLIVREKHQVRFDVHAVSAPRSHVPLVRPLADRLQDVAVKRYLEAMTKLAAV
jgi:uncharacterized protein (UPF0548 family)